MQDKKSLFLQGLTLEEKELFLQWDKNGLAGITTDKRDIVSNIVHQYTEFMGIKLDVKNRDILDKQRKINNISSYLIPNTKVSNDISDKLTFDDIGTQIDLLVSNKKQKEMKVFYSVYFDDNADTSIIYSRKRPLSAYDRAVHNTIVSMYEAGNNQFTLDQITRVMYASTSVGEKQKREVKNSIEKMILTRVKIDCSEQIQGYKELQATYEGYLINADKVSVLADNGKQVEIYSINKKPILYAYAQTINQVASVDIKLLDTKAVTRNTDEIIAIKEYLLRRIEVIKNAKSKTNNTILYDTIFKNCDIVLDTSKTRTQEHRYKKQIKLLLQDWQSKGLFKEFTENKKGNKSISLTIYKHN